MTSLADLLCQERDPRSRVALRWDPGSNSDRVVHWGDLVVDVARLRDRLLQGPSGGWVLLTEDAYCFAVGLLALWHSGRYAISPPNRQPGALRSQQIAAAGVLTDRPDWFQEGTTLDPVSRASSEDVTQEFTARSKTFEALSLDDLAVEFFTSGTTGDEKPVHKALGHLASEVAILGANWDERVAGAVFFTSASHQHLYGMLFGVLWPLCSQHVFQSEHFLHAGELVPRLAAAERSVLASVPTHLKRLAQHVGSPALRDRCCEVFSSGGPLPEETAHRVAALVGDAPIEVFGSTETGGIAWRRQSPDAAANDPSLLWTPFESVELAEDETSGTLRVRSPFVSSGTQDGDRAGAFTIGDRVEFGAGNRFALCGRGDRVVKIGERRLDLTRMESLLRAQDGVDEVALTTLQRDSDDADKDAAEVQERVAAIIVPSEKGWGLIRESGRRALSSGLRRGLAEDWDPVLHPRYWRFVLELPENPQGKTTQSLLRALFQEADWGRLQSDRPDMLGETREGNAVERTALVPADLSCFPGHFADRHVVPGVLQLDWALALAEVWLGRAPRVTQIESLKLLMPLEPGMLFRIRVEHTAPDRLEIRLWSDDQIFSKGRIRIEESNA